MECERGISQQILSVTNSIRLYIDLNEELSEATARKIKPSDLVWQYLEH